MKASDIIEMSRPSVVILSIFALIVGSLIVGVDTNTMILAAIVVLFHSAAGNILNDYFDYEIDKINRPHRALPSGRVKKRQARNISGLFFVIATLIASTINVNVFVLSLFNIFVNYIYSAEMKKKALIGNFGPSWLAASVFIFADLLVDGITPLIIILAIVAFLANVSREIVKDMDDVKGDKKAGAITLPIVAGKRFSGIIASLFLFLAIIISPLPYFLGLSKFYVYIAMIGNFMFLYSLTRMRNPGKAYSTMKLAMFVIVISFFAGTF